MEEVEEKKPKGEKETALDLSKTMNLFELIAETEKPGDTKPKIAEHLKSLIAKSPLTDKYRFLFLWDDAGQIDRYTANEIYSALSAEEEKEPKDILLILYSFGGLVEPAYLISKCCREYRKDRFVVAIPRQAKSAATLLALGAAEIHMGLMSELGPIDPQIGRYPALGLGDAVKYLASLCKDFPDSSDMFAKYLSLSLNLRYLGYLERVAQSAVQYAQRLLENRELPQGQTSFKVAERMVYGYKDHNFVIDRKEAELLLGDDIVKYDTEEYKLADSLHKFLSLASIAFRAFRNTDFRVTGKADSGIGLTPKKQE
jgi:membrane-bound ClpP family serine protease